MRLLVPILILIASSAFAASDPPPALSRELLDFLKRPEANLRIADGALLICKEAHPELDLNAERKTIARLGVELKAAIADEKSISKQAEILAKFIFEDQKFSTPKKDDAEAFLLTDVLRNKRGNCLGLSVLCLALADEAGLKLSAVPVPSRTSESGHMLIRFIDGEARRNFDPGERGVEHPDSFYEKEFKLSAADLKSGYVLGNAKKREVLALLLLNLGGAFVETHRAAEAVPLCEASLQLRGESAAAHSNLAAARLLLGDTAAAEKSYAAALRFDPKFFPARLGKADIAFRKNDPAAEKLINDLATLEPDSVPVRTLQANLQIKRNDLGGAIKTLTTMSELKTADVTVWINLGKCHTADGDLAKAEASYRRAVALDDKSPDAHTGLGKTLQALGRKSEADAEFSIAEKLNAPEAPVAIGPKPVEKAPDYPKGTSVVPFKIVGERIFVPVRLNDKVDTEAILDTGTEVTLLNGARIKLDLAASSFEDLHGDMIGRVAVKMVTLSTLKIGDTIIRNQPIGRTDQGQGTKLESVDFVLGMDIMGKTRFTLDFQRSNLVVWPAASKLLPPAEHIDRINMPIVNLSSAAPIRPFVVGSLNDKHTTKFLIDTAADAPMFAAFSKPSEMGFSVAATPSGVLRVSDGTAKLELNIFQTSFKSLAMGKAAFDEVEGRVIDASSVRSPVTKGDLAFLNVIGTPFLKTLRAIHIDIPGRTLAIDRMK